MDRVVIRNMIVYIVYTITRKSLCNSKSYMYNTDLLDKIPLISLVEDFNLDELDVVDFLVELENIFNVSILLEDFYKLETIGDLINKVCDSVNQKECVNDMG